MSTIQAKYIHIYKKQLISVKLSTNSICPCFLLSLVIITLFSCDFSSSDVIVNQQDNTTLISVSTDAVKQSDDHHGEQQKQTQHKNLWEMVASMGPSTANDGPGTDQFKVTETRQNRHQNNLGSHYHFALTLDQANRFKLDWTYDYNKNQISFALYLNVTSSMPGLVGHKPGFDIFALGFSERGQLENSDYCLIWYDLAQRLHLQDAILNENKELELIDESLSICQLIDHNQQELVTDGGAANRARNLAASRNNKLTERSWVENPVGEVRIQFIRPLDACNDRDHYYSIDNGTTHLNWFSIRGPLLSLNGINLGALEESSRRRNKLRSIKNETTSTTAKSNADVGRFEWGMRRVQLIANKPNLSDYVSARRGLQAPRRSRQFRSEESRTLSSNHERHHDIHMEAFPIPARETTYWCKLFKLPAAFHKRRHHITKYGPLITIGNRHIVHHMELFNCANLSPSEHLELEALYENNQQASWSGECESPKRPPVTKACKRVILAWAMGAKQFEYPVQVGQSIGGSTYSPFVMLEVHYNNVEQSPGLVDFSGLRFEYTSHLRPYDAGILEVGLEYTPKNSIPPGEFLVPLAGHCLGECTRLAFSENVAASSGTKFQHQRLELDAKYEGQAMTATQQEKVVTGNCGSRSSGEGDSTSAASRNGRNMFSSEQTHDNHCEHVDGKNDASCEHDATSSKLGGGGIFIFGAQMHTHLTGVGSWTEHVRGGRLIGELQRDDHYSPHFQEIRLLAEPRYVAPGDSLIHYCLYDARSRSNITLGGFSTQEEMCVTYLHYYPRTDLEVCKSSVDSRALERYFAYLAREESQQTSELLMELHENNANCSYNNNNNNNNRNDHDDNDNPNKQQNGANGRARKLKSIAQNYNSIEWSKKRSLELLEFYSNAPLSVQCNRSDGRRFSGHWTGLQQTQIYSEFSSGDADDQQHRMQQMMHQQQAASQPFKSVTSPLELPFSLRAKSKLKSGVDLAAYRGLNYRRRHAQCMRPADGASRSVPS